MVVPALVVYFVCFFVLGDTTLPVFPYPLHPGSFRQRSFGGPVLLTADTWFAYTYTDSAGTTTVNRGNNGFSNTYTVTRPDDTEESWSGGGNSIARHLDGTMPRFLRESNGALGNKIYANATNNYDQEDTLTSITLRIGQMAPHISFKSLYHVEITLVYDDAGRLVRQYKAMVILLVEDALLLLIEKDAKKENLPHSQPRR